MTCPAPVHWGRVVLTSAMAKAVAGAWRLAPCTGGRQEQSFGMTSPWKLPVKLYSGLHLPKWGASILAPDSSAASSTSMPRKEVCMQHSNLWQQRNQSGTICV